MVLTTTAITMLKEGSKMVILNLKLLRIGPKLMIRMMILKLSDLIYKR